MTPDAIFNVTKNGVITGSHSLGPGKTFVLCTPADDPYDGSIYAEHLGHNATLQLVGNETHQLDIGKTYTVQHGARERNYQLTTTRPPRRERPLTPEDRETPAQHTKEGTNGDLYVGSGN
jgi:hypothetical protein